MHGGVGGWRRKKLEGQGGAGRGETCFGFLCRGGCTQNRWVVSGAISVRHACNRRGQMEETPDLMQPPLRGWTSAYVKWCVVLPSLSVQVEGGGKSQAKMRVEFANEWSRGQGG